MTSMRVERFARGLAVGALAANAVWIGAAAHADESVDYVLAKMGESDYQTYCASCHGLAGKGDGPSAVALKVPPADLTRIAARAGGSFPDGEVSKFIDGRFDTPAHGSREMPVWGARLGENVPESGVKESMARGKIAVLVEYLKSIQERDDSSPGGQ